jgi:hypothetical protein
MLGVSDRALQILRQSDKEATTRAKLRCADAHTGAVANFVDPIKCVDDIDTNSQWLGTFNMKRMTGTKVDLRIRRQRSAIREILA